MYIDHNVFIYSSIGYLARFSTPCDCEWHSSEHGYACIDLCGLLI